MNKNTYLAILNDDKFREQLLSDPEMQAVLKAAFDTNSTKYALLNELLNARREAGLSQADVAERMGTKASAVGRLETGLANGKPSPSISTLQKYAEAVGKKLEIHLV
jgi:DNA-binding XRE family transcriptional regulator